MWEKYISVLVQSIKVTFFKYQINYKSIMVFLNQIVGSKRQITLIKIRR